jgi:hypothetical protein
VIVGGEVVVSGGRCTRVDEQAVLRDIASLAPQIEEFIADCTRGAQRAWRYYDDSYRAGLAQRTEVTRTLMEARHG